MSESAAALVGVFVLGILLGVFFFGGLWFTVKRLAHAKRPFLWVGGSFLFRVTVVLALLLLVAGGRWERLLACLGGFIAARLLMSGLLGRSRALQRGGD